MEGVQKPTFFKNSTERASTYRMPIAKEHFSFVLFLGTGSLTIHRHRSISIYLQLLLDRLSNQMSGKQTIRN